MELVMKKYLESTEFINWESSAIRTLAAQLKSDLETDVGIAEKCFEYVRDSIKHTGDYQINKITCKATEVLAHKTGYCYTKSHLLAALLRANGIPAGLCYQRLSVGDSGAPYCLHGLNAVYLKEFGWYRIDARGNKEGVNASFSPPDECLAFAIKEEPERDIEGIWPEPLSVVVDVLQKYDTCKSVSENLPDIEMYN